MTRRARAFGAATVSALLSIAAASVGFGAASDMREMLDAALVKMQAGDAKGAAGILERLTQTNPTAVAAWPALGRAYQQEHQFDKAIQAYRRALELEAD